MRRTIIGLTIAGAVALVGCSDSEDGVGGEAAGSGSTDAFCAEFASLDERFSSDPEAAADPNAVVEALEQLDPPAEIADDFETVLDAARSLAELDPSDPDAADEAQALNDEAADAQGRVSDYLDANCDLDVSTSEGDGVTDPSATESDGASTTAPGG